MGHLTDRCDSRRGGSAALWVGMLLVLNAAPAQAGPGQCEPPPLLTNPIQYIDKCPEDPGGPAAVRAGGRDVYIQLPADRACASRLSVTNAGNIRITGGQFVYTDGQAAVISLGMSSGTSFIDGVHIDVNGRSADAIRTYRHTGRLIVQNVRIEGVGGRVEGPHGDLVHAQGDGPLQALVLQNVSGYTAYQGLFVPYRESGGHGTRALTLERVNVGYDPDLIVTKPLMLLFFGDNRNDIDKAPDLGTTLSDVFVDGAARDVRFDRTVYARPVPDGAGCATFTPGQGAFEGKVCDGLPPEGEYAPAEHFGVNYDRSAFCTGGPIDPTDPTDPTEPSEPTNGAETGGGMSWADFLAMWRVRR